VVLPADGSTGKEAEDQTGQEVSTARAVPEPEEITIVPVDGSTTSSSPQLISEDIGVQTSALNSPAADIRVTDSPILMSEDQECQTDAPNVCEGASQLLTILSTDAIEQMTAQDLRKVGQDLMSCLNIVFDRMGQSAL